MRGGRPLWFLVIVLSGWTAARGVDLYGAAEGEGAAGGGPLRALAAAIGITPAAAAPAPGLVAKVRHPASPPVAAAAWQRPLPPVAVAPGRAKPRARDEPQVRSAGTPPLLPGVIMAPVPAVAAPGPPPAARPGRWAGSAWLIARNGSAIGLPGSQLGGSQAGARVTYGLTANRRLALAARLSAPLSGRGREAAAGIDWQPTRLPVHVLAEHRIGLDGGRGGPTLAAIGGFGPAEVTRGVVLEGYGQAGVIARDGGEGFADGALRAAHPLATLAGVRIDIGAGIWGGAQRGAARLDVGPTLGLVLPVGGRRLRLSADWRQRIAGDSRPGSGPALSLGTDF
ncbi:hypothetical protein [Sphingomonas sp. CLY1604]|uniref:hypothetical protein n=1 Tax=Sphingomonas sp. CLY1604 TaxID=3457786 RepID=UPI003FD8FB95